MNHVGMMIHVHPELDAQARQDLERKLTGHAGVECAEFEHRPHPHSLIVEYDPDEVKGMELLQMVRELDPAATMVGM